MAAKSPLERAARALRERGKHNGSIVHGDDATGWQHYVDDARAVIEAIREPTDGMIEHAFNHMEANGNDPRFAWEAMIDQLLADGE